MMSKVSPWGITSLSGFILNRFTDGENTNSNLSFNVFKLAHYSSCRKGSALFYRAIVLRNLIRHFSRNNHFHLNKPNFAIWSRVHRSTEIPFSAAEQPFSYFFFGLSGIAQTRNYTSISKYYQKNGINNFGQLPYITAQRSSNLKLKNLIGPNIGSSHHHKFFRWAALKNQAYWVFTSINSRKLERSYWNNLKIKSSIRFANSYSFNMAPSPLANNLLGVNSGSLFFPLMLNIVSLVAFIRTIWFTSIVKTNLSINGRNYSDYSSEISRLVSSYGSLALPFSSGYGSNNILLACSKWDDEYIDPDRFSKSPTSSKKRRFFNRKHFTFRIGLGFWGKKIWQFRKSRKFWNYIRSLYGFFFRSFKAHGAFKNRLDVFILRFFAVRNILYARSLIKAGHVFVGSYNPRNPMYQVERHGIVTLSKKALVWTSGRTYNHKENYGHNRDSEIKSIRRVQKTSALRFARQQKDMYMLGDSKFFKYVMYYADDADVVFADSRKSKFFSLNFFYSQKVINSAWW